ncbi:MULTISPECIES: ABC transporter ATP-binding protein [unclassified Paracoccus (in: a-proteobacteria)]|uniref:ABC transporter ATP-binding protein n=1 Tax=unclassified Paracoccus (in: a-proteobacteria) TaxID=2688777 RepID=UPI002372C048|nr:ABC transporter ATP-binding protein [Paracoccus sp. UBA5162]MCS5600619.1 ABC transporter ATP-binding protein [Paracoccus sp. (in: a-proteobacteria)]MDB2552555.1 ABC transporter ATP-binding protein [Paracoccus sp. (in: a-proteobacteria)]|tara:strand:- start:265 stop:1893 length:1629 start_codon:yes stop_codon:yes gene_type:complete
MSLLEISGLRIALNGDADQQVVKGLDLSIEPGQTMCLVGESGSGKSLTALATMGLLPSALKIIDGSIRLQGEELTTARPSRMRNLRATVMSMIFQEPMTALNPVARVGQQIEEVLEFHSDLSQSRRKSRVKEMMEAVHLPDVDKMYRSFPHQLSGGQRQRIMIAMALVMRPQLLIADEPTTALDVTTQAQILSLIGELREKQGSSVLFITHDMGVVSEIADDVTVLKLGEVMETQSVENLLRHPQTDYSRDLLRSVPSQVPRPARDAVSDRVVLETRDLSKTYGGAGWFGRGREVKAVQDVSISVTKGRTLGIVGESGSGKSTVARCIMRLIDPSSGAIMVGGRDIATLSQKELKPQRKKIQIVFQDPMRSLNPRIEIGQSIIEGPLNFGMPRDKAIQRARELLTLVGLPASAVDRFPHQFSGGQRQRIAIARALAMDPDVLVADEAVSALDVSVQAQVLDLLAELQQRLGLGILFITHDLGVAAQICDDVLVMQHGRAVEYGPAAEVLGNPKQDYTKALIQAAPGRHWDFANFRPFAEAAE